MQDKLLQVASRSNAIYARQQGVAGTRAKQHPVKKLADQLKDEISDNDEDVAYVMPEHVEERPHKSAREIRKEEISSDERHAERVLPEHAVEGKHMSRAAMRQQEISEDERRADAVLPEHNVERKLSLKESQIAKKEEDDNQKSAEAVVLRGGMQGILDAERLQLKRKDERFHHLVEQEREVRTSPLLVVERKHPKVTKVEKELKEQQPRISNVPMVKDASQKLRDAQSIRLPARQPARQPAAARVQPKTEGPAKVTATQPAADHEDKSARIAKMLQGGRSFENKIHAKA
ncbi:hypothetical protein GUITHDRAFT_164458 [Guillardia theta CCMP2712]|uniref:Uncharacterized protein n=1 Tax=Guillardia theta (strain CCMP2712) TaxID=905079 RepID=L1IY51_GUITC|nr:hypothetical protein GUITHDRAFT_164458 [Guillardia theta CCMP2712]EKX41037.1 hypothetical protein GUITHDRAFT_164458 [Guillardia theta CCMP2712]|eukprot:XP_005828017.1 hypothetical protein GUITHDRAFT_164458 [Guillardia theta CCMP2712]